MLDWAGIGGASLCRRNTYDPAETSRRSPGSGYGFMSLATLFAARVFTGPGLDRTIRLFLTANGLLLPFITLQNF